MKPKAFLCSLVAVILFSSVADAQLFRRNIQRSRSVSVQSNCPGGVCPTAQTTRTRSVLRVAPALAPVIVAPVIVAPTSIMQRAPQASEQTFGLGGYVAVEIPKHVLAQVDEEPIEVARESFRSALLKTVAKQRKAGKISVRDAVKIRVALWSPAFVDRAHELAVTQVAFSGEVSEHVPVDAEGVVQVNGINWEGLAKFLEAFIPLLLTLLKAFGL